MKRKRDGDGLKKLCIVLLIGICLMCLADIWLSYSEYIHYQRKARPTVIQPEQHRPDKDLRRRLL